MDRIGIAFRSHDTPQEVQDRYIRPLREAIGLVGAGFYANYLRQVDPEQVEPTEHLVVFEVHDFKEGLRALRIELEKLGAPEGTQFQNLNPSSPGY